MPLLAFELCILAFPLQLFVHVVRLESDLVKTRLVLGRRVIRAIKHTFATLLVLQQVLLELRLQLIFHDCGIVLGEDGRGDDGLRLHILADSEGARVPLIMADQGAPVVHIHRFGLLQRVKAQIFQVLALKLLDVFPLVFSSVLEIFPLGDKVLQFSFSLGVQFELVSSALQALLYLLELLRVRVDFLVCHLLHHRCAHVLHRTRIVVNRFLWLRRLAEAGDGSGLNSLERPVLKEVVELSTPMAVRHQDQVGCARHAGWHLRLIASRELLDAQRVVIDHFYALLT